VKGLVRHFTSIMGDFLDSVLNIDARCSAPCGRCSPSPVTSALEYFEGHRIRFVSPVRLFVFLSIVTIFVAQFTLDFEGGNVQLHGGDEGIRNAKTVQQVEARRKEALGELTRARRDAGDTPGVGIGLDAAATAIGCAGRPPDLPRSGSPGRKAGRPRDRSAGGRRRDLVQRPPLGPR
jgi:hypothetical protein